ncbi:pseudouridine synthase [Candidatus Methylospira mobilis]|uniref:Pseudouridine synthase n=1 Tax=Candidatus Methylospira mobilis TaxID=1808979 RepID=A0A5Q0BN23_9GAMM|nr:pseudouridine synthase [Candidatus Methylospira mobilis]QFY43497.1 pseudouridine synthase [Candidatus Methylospira mobilis]WNV03963.1 pseudouridine synthase [Candidatus Methylospira mobilis]
MTNPRKPPLKSQKPVADAPGERIQKVLAHAGLASRREIEGWIGQGEVQINGHVAKLGDRWHPGDFLTLRGRVVNVEKRLDAKTRVLVYHKPEGEMVTRRDPDGRPVVFSNLPRLDIGRWVAIGRLDINTQGLLLLTNNGELANRMMHPSQQVEREYAVRILGDVSDDTLKRLQDGVELEDGKAYFNKLEFAGGEGANRWYHVTLMEGRNRIVRRLWESQRVAVSRLIRIRYGDTVLPPGLKARAHYELNEAERDALLVSAGLPPEAPVKIKRRPAVKRGGRGSGAR